MKASGCSLLLADFFQNVAQSRYLGLQPLLRVAPARLGLSGPSQKVVALLAQAIRFIPQPGHFIPERYPVRLDLPLSVLEVLLQCLPIGTGAGLLFGQMLLCFAKELLTLLFQQGLERVLLFLPTRPDEPECRGPAVVGRIAFD